MTIWLLVIIPCLTALLAYAVPTARVRPLLLPLCAVVHLFLTVSALREIPEPVWNGMLAMDPLAQVTIPVISLLFLCCFLYIPYYLDIRGGQNNRLFCSSLALLLGATTLVMLTQHFALLWVALEATTLSVAPLLFFNRTSRALEAVWKYMLIGSVGIALALLGTFFLAYSSLHQLPGSGELVATLSMDELTQSARMLSSPWLHAAFVTLMIGYGTKMGLAPMHTWKPDTYGEAPGVVGALLAGGVTSCGFVAMARTVRIMNAAGFGEVVTQVLVTFGIASMLIAAVFLIGQRDYKRMLAYSSVEHMGILAIGLGVGGLGLIAALFHLVNNAFAKGLIFLAVGNIHRAYGSKEVADVRGALLYTPVSASLFLLAFLALTGSPPFAPFFSEFTLVRALYSDHRYVTAGTFLVLLMIIFLGMGATALTVVQGAVPAKLHGKRSDETLAAVLPLLLLLVPVLTLGVFLPESFQLLFEGARLYIEGAH